MSYKSVLAGGFITVLVLGAMAATEPATTPGQAGVPPQTSAQPPASNPAKAPAAPAAQTPPQTSKEALPLGHPPSDLAAKPDANKAPAQPVKKVDLNNASLAELKTLPTVSDEYAKKIIAHRPYKSKGELVTKAGLPEGVYQAVRHKIEMQTPRKAAPKK